MKRHHILVFTGVLLLLTPAVMAKETARQVWVQAKCALCHGLDGSSQTDTGRKVQAPDLRTPQTQKRTDDELAKNIAGGHKKMPSFEKQFAAEKVRLLVEYIRGLAPK